MRVTETPSPHVRRSVAAHIPELSFVLLIGVSGDAGLF
jgi:hypothetical protein